MQPDKLEQLKVRMNESIANVMSELPYKMEVSRFDSESPNYDPEAKKGPIQTQVDRMLEYIEKLDTEYKLDAQNKSSTPSTDTTPQTDPAPESRVELIAPDGTRITVPERQKEQALSKGYKLP